MTFQPGTSVTVDGSNSERCDHLKQVIERAALLLPPQGPITSFVALNTLQALEELPFSAGVAKATRIFGCQGYLPEDQFRRELARGRIRETELRDVLNEDLGDRGQEPILSFGTRFDLRFAMLKHPLIAGPDIELRWFVAETDALRKMSPAASDVIRERFVQTTRQWIVRDARGATGGDGATPRAIDPRIQAILANLPQNLNKKQVEIWSNEDWEAFALSSLWRICREGVLKIPACQVRQPPSTRHRNLLLQATGQDSDRLVHDILIPFCAAFLDQGFAHWSLPHRQHGFFQSFCALYMRPAGSPDAWFRDLHQELHRLNLAQVDSLTSIRESLEALGIADDELDDFLSETLVALRGWTGMIYQVELRSDSVAHTIPKGSLIDFLAVRLVLERFALAHVARTAFGYQGSLKDLRQAVRNLPSSNCLPTTEQRAFQVFQLAQIQGWVPSELFQLSVEDWTTLVEEIESFSSFERRKLFQIAFERRFQVQTLDAIAIQSKQSAARVPHPRFQAVFCLDDREESYRRHLEEIAPDVETFGAAGFFNVPIYYRGADHAHFVPLCPIVMKPQNWVVETVGKHVEHAHFQRTQRRKVLGSAAHRIHMGSRGLGIGALLTAGLGVLTSIPLISRILFPRFTGRLRKSASDLVRPPQDTHLQVERKNAGSPPSIQDIGFSVEEMTNCVQRLLTDIGLISGFSRLVFIVGHGSSSLNNPHKSAYDCGACGGGIGGPNARALAFMINDPRIRENLAKRGLTIPPDTWVIGGWHNTCDDSVELFDTEKLPATHQAEFERARQDIEAACERNAHERCRRFQSAPLTMDFAAARRHVEGRSEDLAQTRPEYGHASTAMCIVGRRSRTRGLFLDRRAFLTSYDPTEDDANGTVLARILAAAVPVCGGINLAYYFSYVDNPGYGAGVKLPHNVTSLLGVMDGAASDLRTGLPWQGVEIHQPLRNLFVIETTPEIMLKIMDQNATIGRMCRNEWVLTALLNPHSSEILVFQNGKFVPYVAQTHELPKVRSSTEWYGGLRDNLEFASIEQ